jgi:hypothetical protein
VLLGLFAFADLRDTLRWSAVSRAWRAAAVACRTPLSVTFFSSAHLRTFAASALSGRATEVWLRAWHVLPDLARLSRMQTLHVDGRPLTRTSASGVSRRQMVAALRRLPQLTRLCMDGQPSECEPSQNRLLDALFAKGHKLRNVWFDTVLSVARLEPTTLRRIPGPLTMLAESIADIRRIPEPSRVRELDWFICDETVRQPCPEELAAFVNLEVLDVCFSFHNDPPHFTSDRLSALLRPMSRLHTLRLFGLRFLGNLAFLRACTASALSEVRIRSCGEDMGVDDIAHVEALPATCAITLFDVFRPEALPELQRRVPRAVLRFE